MMFAPVMMPLPGPVPNPSETHACIVGGGIAALSTACILIRDAGLPPSNIQIFEEGRALGGAMDGAGDAAEGYVSRGGRMLNRSYVCLYDLLKGIPTLNNPNKSVYQEIMDFTEQHKTSARARLVDSTGTRLDVSDMGFDTTDRAGLLEIWNSSEHHLGTKEIRDIFRPHMFTTNFWYMWATTFAFQPWHSAVEFKRYLHRFIHEFPHINTLEGVDRTVYNQFDSIIRPITAWLKSKGVVVVNNSKVLDIDFTSTGDRVCAKRLHLLRNGKPDLINLDQHDLVFVTNGSMTSSSSIGSMTAAPQILNSSDTDPAWTLWANIATKLGPEFAGHPSNFVNRCRESEWESFTITMSDPKLMDLIINFTDNAPGTGALCTFKDSAWLMSIVVPHQPHFLNQPESVSVIWGYGMFVNKPGDFIKKPMASCTGSEVLQELLHHLGMLSYLPSILPNVNVLPVMLPYITSQFLTRGPSDRPKVVPHRSVNFAWLGQWTEIPEDTVFTVEYSVRSSMLAVYGLMMVAKSPDPIYKGAHHVDVALGAAKALFT